jgi:hypothetical protein
MKDKLRGSVLNVQKLLIQAIANPENWIGDSKFVASISSQGSLASYADTSRGILGMSLNTFIKHSNTLAGGFKGVDGLRSELKILLAKKAPIRAHKESRRCLTTDKQELSRLLKLQDIALHEQVLVIQRLMDLAWKLAVADLPNRIAYYEKEIKFIHAVLYYHGRMSHE